MNKPTDTPREWCTGHDPAALVGIRNRVAQSRQPTGDEPGPAADRAWLLAEVDRLTAQRDRAAADELLQLADLFDSWHKDQVARIKAGEHVSGIRAYAVRDLLRARADELVDSNDPAPKLGASGGAPTDVGPSVRQPAPELGADWLLRAAISDPGSITPRGDNYAEPIPSWSMRAVLQALAEAGYAIVRLPEAVATD